LSAIANVPLKQSLAVTGSVNQRGEVQAIGAVNDKIEGFFDLCVARGLSGQGVVIPAANVRHLMLRADVVDAVRAGSFHIHAVRTIDEGLEILTGQPAGERGLDGEYLVGTFNHRVDERLTSMAMTRLEFASLANGQGAISDDDAIAAISGTGAR
ncbi:MAG TPA: S16 family serine protease, partial [Candidatus Kapabacteria bacterium]|nr:S16 family serine protease [Candidatus Kapabacteria bacterium]